MEINNVELSFRDDEHKKKYIATLLDLNIILDEDNKLPNCGEKFINFKSDYSPAYDRYSNGAVNTRLRYPFNTDTPKQIFSIYCKLNWWQRQKLSYIERRSWFHKHPIPTIALIINILAGIINIVIGFINYGSAIQNSNQKTIEQQTELLRQQSVIMQKQFEITEKYFTGTDSLVKKKADSLRLEKKNAP